MLYLFMIRPARPSDLPLLLELARSSGLFDDEQLELLRITLYPALNSSLRGAAFCLASFAADGACLGLAYAEPERMTDAVWNLQLIAVHPAERRRGLGSALLSAVGAELRSRTARLLLVDTSGTPDFEPVRDFYRGFGFSEESQIRDFYAPGVSKITFRLVLTPPSPS